MSIPEGDGVAILEGWVSQRGRSGYVRAGEYVQGSGGYV